MEVKFKKLTDNAHIPTRGSAFSAGYDLYATDDLEVLSQHTVKVHTGLAMEIPEGYLGAIFARSGLATRNGLRPANCVGVVDSDYRGEIIVAIHNDSNFRFTINEGDRIAQIVIIPYANVDYVLSDELSSTDRAGGGFGSTGV